MESPILYLSNYIIHNKKDYYVLLQEVRTRGAWEDWILFMLKGVEETASETNMQIKAIHKLFLSTQKKIQEGAPKAYHKELLEILFEHPYCRIEMLTNRLSISRITASKYLRQLETLGVLKSRQVWKETLYINTKLCELLKKQ